MITTPESTSIRAEEDGQQQSTITNVEEQGTSSSGWDIYGRVGNTAATSSLFVGAGTANIGLDDDNIDSAHLPTVQQTSRTIGSGRTGTGVEENIVVALLPEKEGLFMFQHHNYEVISTRRGSKVIRSAEQLVVMFLTVPTELSVWRKQATISVQDEFDSRPLLPGLEESLSLQLETLFVQTRAGVRRSTDLYVTVCNIMDRLVKRSEGVANDHARLAVSLQSITEANLDTYATDTNDVPLLNDGLIAMGKRLRTGQSLMEDEAKAWDEGVLEDLKRQRDALVSLRDLFDRRDRLDRDNIPYLERRIQSNETKRASLLSKDSEQVKSGDVEKLNDSITKDKEAIVKQHNRSVLVKECIRDELVYFQSTQYHVSRWNQDWAQERVKYSEMLADNWRRLLDELDGMPLGD
ncbi:sorting nexin mvp1 [Grosmannia clavigera kw1407]|uniref:Sorting nexin mvp1 n=1 Tax=Grosmannia clavigera (strain kw1407 / UAMH 11150) TaxID=655863 RepID=F0XL77_GROCL|nr:sorting nexin mvp1 [Grosmannia clavigera kw1407]EFX01563.1 sorting nexin mvp1 [Grosmannia clavigera kw1407]